MAKGFKHIDIQVLAEFPQRINKSLSSLNSAMAKKAAKILQAEIKNKAYDKGTLANSIDYVTETGNNAMGFKVLVTGDARNYDVFQDIGGRQKTFPNIDSIMSWLKSKRGTQGRRSQWKSRKLSRKKRKDELKRNAYLVARAIYKKGIKAKDFYDPAVEKIDKMVNSEVKKWVHNFQMK